MKKSDKKAHFSDEHFLDFFEAFKSRKDFIKSADEEVNKLEFNLISYNETLDNIERDKIYSKVLKEEKFFNDNKDVNFY